MAENIDDFNRGVGLVMSTLYENFPKPLLLDLYLFKDHSDLLDPSDERLKDRLNVYGHTVMFLESEGYLRFDNNRLLVQFNKTVLTSKGLAVLSKTPETFSNRPTVGDKIKEALNESGTETLKGIVRIVLGSLT